MQIKTKESVQKTLKKYNWNVDSKWIKQSNSLGFERQVYSKGDLKVIQNVSPECQSVVFETPDYTMTVMRGTVNTNNFAGITDKTTLYGLTVYTTNMENRIYTTEQDDTGWKNISGNRDILYHFLEKIPDAYFVLEKDEGVKHISSHWQKTFRCSAKTHTRFID